MPHCLAKVIEFPSFPFEENGYRFLFEAHQYGNLSQSLILVHFGDCEFFLRKRFRKDRGDFIVKCEKISRNIPTGVIKGALRIIANLNSSHLITHNLLNDSPKQNLLSPFLKQIQDFVDFARPFELEIGFGSGRHLLNRAQKYPEMQFVGIEIHTPSIEQVLRQIELRGLENLWIINFDARVFMELLPSSLCEAIYLHFPVPWGKKPHRRVWSKRFIDESMRILRRGGMLELRSDDEDYFLYALNTALQAQHLSCKINKNLQKEIVSKYEDRWLKQQKDIYDLQVYALNEDQRPKERYDFGFPSKLSLSTFDTIQRKIVGPSWFLHIDSFYTSDDLSVLMLSFGDFGQPQSKFLLISGDGKARYLGGDPLPTQAAYFAHQELLKIIAQGGEH
ncbi:tRNA (guanosine(46)-N7)-methyltransferase TrmB [Helicobacter pametensis]|uniref:tRNA (guanosine(46)-N7)-methyltransferase TrmB n=1 Tax=Helicobacter pametensis TaxID=95149 RepID=UPI00047F1085|nr:tRNA (guanosine(46)-N7)-methyltransferase TrmB [Helicobacter pametensis]